jgi:hypothetical protein
MTRDPHAHRARICPSLTSSRPRVSTILTAAIPISWLLKPFVIRLASTLSISRWRSWPRMQAHCQLEAPYMQMNTKQERCPRRAISHKAAYTLENILILTKNRQPSQICSLLPNSQEFSNHGIPTQPNPTQPYIKKT